MRRLLAAFALCCALAVSAYAGEIDCGRTGEPPAADATACGDISCGVTQAILTFLSLL